MVRPTDMLFITIAIKSLEGRFTVRKNADISYKNFHHEPVNNNTNTVERNMEFAVRRGRLVFVVRNSVDHRRG